MKNLKTFERYIEDNSEIEESDNLKFKIGDYVRLKAPEHLEKTFGKGDESTIYRINAISTIDKQYDLFFLDGDRKGFRMEDFLVKVPDVEADAMKYNI
jgi:hypothetical protein